MSVGQAVGRVVARVKRAATADGADESGLAALLWTHALSSAGDALVTVALAGTVFFSVPLGQARGRVALYLLLTLLPFSLLVPVAGPVLDRFRHGRRNVLAVTAAGRGLVAWSMATLTASLGLYPAALAVLVLSRAYGVARSAATPRVKPPSVSLVAANARLNVASVASASVAGVLGAGVLKLLGSGWVLRVAALVLLVAAVCAVRLPAQVDEARPERRVRAARYRLLAGVPVVRPLATAAALRALAGFLTIFLAFLLKGSGAAAPVVAVVLGAAVGGQLVGTALASRLPEHVTARLTLASLAVPAVACGVTAVLGGALLEALCAGLAGASYSLSKFALDAAVQTHVPAASVSGAFSRSETALQLSWALGGALALAVPTTWGSASHLGFALAAALPVVGAVLAVQLRRRALALPSSSPVPPVEDDVERPPSGEDQPTSVVVRRPLGEDEPTAAVPRPYGEDGPTTVLPTQPAATDRPARTPDDAPRPWWVD